MSIFDEYIYIQFISAEPEVVLSKLSLSGVELYEIEYIDMLTVKVKIERNRLKIVESTLSEFSSTYKEIKKEGFLWQLVSGWRRPVLAVGLLMYFLAALMIPNRVYYIDVEGNETLSKSEILLQAENCGIRFGMTTAAIRSEEVKNALLFHIPQLQWVGITTTGTVATIHVKERSGSNPQAEFNNTVSNIVAAYDGMITEQTVYRGTPLFQVGQSVKMGDVLISGYTDCGIKLQAERAVGEVFAHTLRSFKFVAPHPAENRGEVIDKKSVYKIRIGKKVINLYNHSGIMDAGCVKMYSEDYWSLPGGFRLPVSWIKIECVYYAQSKNNAQIKPSDQWLTEYAENYLISQMVAGVILDKNLRMDESDGLSVLTGEYACHEMIGIELYEGNIVQYAEDS